MTTATPVITTETATVRDVQQGQEIEALPMNYRGKSTTPLNAIVTLPGITTDSTGPTGSNGVSIAGSHPGQNEFTVDGFSVTSPLRNGPTPEMFPSTEQISQVKVTSQLATAEYGQVGDVTFITKAGPTSTTARRLSIFRMTLWMPHPTLPTANQKSAITRLVAQSAALSGCPKFTTARIGPSSSLTGKETGNIVQRRLQIMFRPRR